MGQRVRRVHEDAHGNADVNAAAAGRSGDGGSGSGGGAGGGASVVELGGLYCHSVTPNDKFGFYQVYRRLYNENPRDARPQTLAGRFLVMPKTLKVGFIRL